MFFCVYIPAHIRFMVAQAGLTSVRPVSSFAGILTPVWATTIQERENSGGSTTN
ncbi:TPA: ash family protein [Escherichia coli]|nr:ash family protein [Escherichia coli]